MSIDRAIKTGHRRFRVDVHTHIFNGEDVDGLGYLFQHSDPASEPLPIMKPVAALVKALVSIVKWRAPGQHAEMRLLDNLLDRRAERIKRNKYSRDRRQLLATLESDVLDLNNASWRQSHTFRGDQNKLQDEVTRHLEQSLQNPATDAGAALQAIHDELGDPNLLLKIRSAKNHPLNWLLHPMLAGRFHGTQNWIGGFAKAFVSHRIINAIHLLRRYPDIDLFVAASLDVDHWFLGGFHGRISNPSEPLEKQIEMGGKIAVLTEGRILPRTGFDPLRQIYWEMSRSQGSAISGQEPVKTLVKACDIWGSVGAKLYPVVGFRPWNNTGLGDVPPLKNEEYRHLRERFLKDFNVDFKEGNYELSRAFDAALGRLYKACDEGHYTVMAHTNHSHGANYDAEDRTAPYFFADASNTFRNVRFNLGHFGGLGSSEVCFQSNKPMKKSQEGEWPRWPELIVKYFSEESHSLYADISFIDPSPKNLPLKNLAYFLDKFPASRKRIMYGSDWHEVLTSTISRNYYRDWTHAFEFDDRFMRHADAILGNNAVDFLGLHPGKKCRSRLDKFFEAWNVRPDWMDLVDHHHKSVL